MKKSFLFLFFLANNITLLGQELPFERVDISDSVAIENQMQLLANSINTKNLSKLDLFKFQLIGGKYNEALVTFQKRIKETPKDQRQYLDVYMHYVKAKFSLNFKDEFKISYRNYLKKSDDLQVLKIDEALIIRDPSDYYISNFNNTYRSLKSNSLSQQTIKDLVKKYFLKTVFSSTRNIYFKEIKEDHKRRYIVNDSIIIPTKDGAEVPVVLIQRKGNTITKNASILISSIYAGTNETSAMLAASKGYNGVIMNTRGKRLSKGPIIPFEYEHTDVYEVLEWVSNQSWSNKKIGMFGGSYDGFSQWASMKHKVHPALKTIVPMVSVAPGIEYPMENNVLHNFSYSWYFYVTNNKMLDFEVVNDYKRWNTLKNTWYKTGVAFNKLDSLDGYVNKSWNKYMAHPSYDDYWKNMIPYKQEFTKINIPILTITGYYDDSQRGAMYYFNEHHKYVKNTNHYLVVGPYDHWTAQNRPADYLRNYKLDDAAQIDIRYDLTFEWFDYILKGKKKPSILKDKVNFQIMDTDTWMHKPSLSAMTNDTLKFHLNAIKNGDFNSLTDKTSTSKVELLVDFKDRKTMNNTGYYPWPLEREKINLKDGLIFKSDVLDEDVIINGSFLGDLEFFINKKDVDFSVILYQLTPEGKYFHLSYYIGRASYAKSREKRELLKQHQLNKVHFENSKLISKKLAKGSRIVAVVNVNKNFNSQINYGTGKDVNTESIKDADVPLKITFTGNSSISIPIWRK